MKAGNAMTIDDKILGLAKRLVSVSDFSQGKTAKIFDDIKENNSEYIVLKNNKPMAVMLSLDEYSEIVNKASKMESLLELIEENRLLKETAKVSQGFDTQ